MQEQKRNFQVRLRFVSTGDAEQAAAVRANYPLSNVAKALRRFQNRIRPADAMPADADGDPELEALFDNKRWSDSSKGCVERIFIATLLYDHYKELPGANKTISCIEDLLRRLINEYGYWLFPIAQEIDPRKPTEPPADEEPLSSELS